MDKAADNACISLLHKEQGTHNKNTKLRRYMIKNRMYAFNLNILDEKQTKITMLLKRCKLDYFGDLLQYFLFFQCKKENSTFLILNLSDQCEEDLISNVEEKKTLFHKKDMKMELEIVCILYNIKLKIDPEIEYFH